MAFKFKLKDHVRDKVSGFEGIVMGRYEYATGCFQYGIAPMRIKDDGSMHEWETLDESRLQLVKPKKKIDGLKARGGPQPNAPRMK